MIKNHRLRIFIVFSFKYEKLTFLLFQVDDFRRVGGQRPGRRARHPAVDHDGLGGQPDPDPFAVDHPVHRLDHGALDQNAHRRRLERRLVTDVVSGGPAHDHPVLVQRRRIVRIRRWRRLRRLRSRRRRPQRWQRLGPVVQVKKNPIRDPKTKSKNE